MPVTIEQINTAFRPKNEIENPKQFIGRYEEIQKSLDFLMTDGAFLLIYGLRGLGKSSLANQIMKIASGDKTLIKSCQLTKFVPQKGFDYIVHTIRCDEYIKTIEDIIKRIVLGDESNDSLYSHLKKEGVKSTKATEFFAKRDNFKQTIEDKTNEDISKDLIHLFRQSLSVIRKDNQDKSGIIILIDEFDIIDDKSKFASLIKSISNDYIKFGIVGIADDIHDLVTDHASIARQMEPIEVGLMTKNELRKIIKHAEGVVKREIKFTEDAKKEIIEKAKGFPYFVHLIGKEALMRAFKQSSTLIDLAMIKECSTQIKNGLSTSIHEVNYNLLCSTNIREKMLRLIASYDEHYIKVEKIYSDFKDLYDIEIPSKYLDELLKSNTQKSTLKLVKKKAFCRFNDPLFKLYVNMRDVTFEE